jgi:hypothetical protein
MHVLIYLPITLRNSVILSGLISTVTSMTRGAGVALVADIFKGEFLRGLLIKNELVVYMSSRSSCSRSRAGACILQIARQ